MEILVVGSDLVGEGSFEKVARKCGHSFESVATGADALRISNTVEEVLNAREVAWPLTRPMCSPIGDGAAAVVICTEEFAKKMGASHGVEVAACMLASGEDPEKEKESSTLARLARSAKKMKPCGGNPMGFLPN